MKTFQIRLNRANPWDSQILAFLEAVPPYYRSRALKEAVLAYLQLPGPPGPSAAGYAREQLQGQDVPPVAGRSEPVEGSDR
jgi:hypothetical protein